MVYFYMSLQNKTKKKKHTQHFKKHSKRIYDGWRSVTFQDEVT